MQPSEKIVLAVNLTGLSSSSTVISTAVSYQTVVATTVITGPRGEKGSDGPAGPAGATGPQGPQGPAGEGSNILPEDNTWTGYNQFVEGIVLPSNDGSGVLWLATMNPDGSWQTSLYSQGIPNDSFIAENGTFYFVSEDGLNYFAQEA